MKTAYEWNEKILFGASYKLYDLVLVKLNLEDIIQPLLFRFLFMRRVSATSGRFTVSFHVASSNLFRYWCCVKRLGDGATGEEDDLAYAHT